MQWIRGVRHRPADMNNGISWLALIFVLANELELDIAQIIDHLGSSNEVVSNIPGKDLPVNGMDMVKGEGLAQFRPWAACWASR